MTPTYKVLTRVPTNNTWPFRVIREFVLKREALEAAAHLEMNTELEVIIEYPDNSLHRVPLSMMRMMA